MAHQRLADDAEQPAGQEVVFHGDEQARLAGGAQHGVHVNRLGHAHIDQPHRHALGLQPRLGLPRLAQQEAVDENGHVLVRRTFRSASHLGFPNLKRLMLIPRHRLQRIMPDVGRIGAVDNLWQGQHQILLVGRAEDVEAGDAAHERHVLDSLVRRPVAVGQEAGHAADQLDRQAADTHVGAHELEGAQGQERGQGVEDGHTAAQGQPGRRADHRLLGDAGVDETAGQ